MGCDGGTIPRRDELVRVQKKPEQKDKDSEREFRWLHCALTQQRLQEPIAMCGLGRLYSKQSVLESLLEKDKMPEVAQHIRSLKDIKTLNMTPNPAYSTKDKSQGLLKTLHAPYICKLIGLEMSGKFRFVAFWTCGCVISERALKQIKSTISICPICQTPYSVEDIIVLNGNDEDLEMMNWKMEMRSVKRKNCKKEKKEKKVKVTVPINQPESIILDSRKFINSEEGPSTSKISSGNVNHSAILGRKKSHDSKPKLISKRVAATTNLMQDPELKRLKIEYSVAKDPKASDVYKSLFTSHKTEKEQERAHWVTYNPFYN